LATRWFCLPLIAPVINADDLDFIFGDLARGRAIEERPWGRYSVFTLAWAHLTAKSIRELRVRCWALNVGVEDLPVDPDQDRFSRFTPAPELYPADHNADHSSPLQLNGRMKAGLQSSGANPIPWTVVVVAR